MFIEVGLFMATGLGLAWLGLGLGLGLGFMLALHPYTLRLPSHFRSCACAYA